MRMLSNSLVNSLAKALVLAGLVLASAAASADVVVIVSAKNAASTMTANEISAIYLGKSNALKPVDNTGAVRTQFYSQVAGKDEAQVKAIWSKLVFTGKATPPKELASSSDVVKAVGADPNAIGYVEKSAVDSTVKVIYEVK
jgi:ABC-type phosphate transport system substrate-binding protein